MSDITRYREFRGKGILDEFPDGRSYAYFTGDRAVEAIIKIESDNTTSIIDYTHPDFSVLEAPAADPNDSLAGLEIMNEARHHKWRLSIWFEFFWWPQVATVWQSNLTETREYQIQIAKGAMDAWYTDPTLSLALATNLVDNSVKPKFTEIGITDIPFLFVRLATDK